MLPTALQTREQIEALHRRQGDTATLAFDLTNRAELLIRLGRFDAAEPVFAELQRGIDTHVDAFVGRERRVYLLRSLAAVTQLRFETAETMAARVVDMSQSRGIEDSTQRLADVLLAYARSVRRKPFGDAALASDITKQPPALRHELQYFRVAAWLASGDAPRAVDTCGAALRDLDTYSSDESDWRTAALCTAAARRARDDAGAGQLAARARAALTKLRAAWKADALEYERRPDLTERRRDAGIGSP